MQEKNKVSLLDWRFKLGVFLLVLALLMVVVALILMPTAQFAGRFESYGNGFWAVSHYGVKDLLFHWTSLDDQAVIEAYSSHPFAQIFVALLLFIFLVPIFIILGVALIVRWWVKTRI